MYFSTIKLTIFSQVLLQIQARMVFVAFYNGVGDISLGAGSNLNAQYQCQNESSLTTKNSTAL